MRGVGTTTISPTTATAHHVRIMAVPIRTTSSAQDIFEKLENIEYV